MTERISQNSGFTCAERVKAFSGALTVLQRSASQLRVSVDQPKPNEQQGATTNWRYLQTWFRSFIEGLAGAHAAQPVDLLSPIKIDTQNAIALD